MQVHSDTEEGGQAHLIFGLGMIGRHVLNALRQGRRTECKSLPFNWTRRTDNMQELKSIRDEVLTLCRDRHLSCLCVLWSAGKGGFALDDAELEQELTAFSQVLDLAVDLQSTLPSTRISFHMLSSAGGLYEGQTHVRPESQPKPRRSYGELKLMQENLLDSSEFAGQKAIYRPSTVYGFSGADQRMGLVARLIWDRLNGRVTDIYGGLDTKRDYVYAPDIGRFIAKKLRYDSAEPLERHMLVAGKATTINEIINIVGKIHAQKPYLHYVPSGFNSEDNSYTRQVLPSNWKATDLETGIRLVYSEIMKMRSQS